MLPGHHFPLSQLIPVCLRLVWDWGVPAHSQALQKILQVSSHVTQPQFPNLTKGETPPIPPRAC